MSTYRSLVLFVCLFASSTVFALPINSCPANQPFIDGAISSYEWSSAQTIDLQVNLPEGGVAPARLYLMNDSKNLYVALRIARTKPDAATTFSVTLDANYDRALSAGDDGFGITHDAYNDIAIDNVYFTGGECPAGALCSSSDVDFRGTNDVSGAVGFDGTYMTYELRKPLMTSDRNDGTMLAGTSMAMTFAVRLLAAGAEWPYGVADTYYPSVPSAGLYVDYIIKDCGYTR
ncbi:MAG TPA: hypothetical protein VF698_10535 [Thermoanaerobaculia bacterium]|jgi:hypothetical protein